MDIHLPDDASQFIRSLIESGRYASVEEAITAAVRLLEARERERAARLEELRREIAIGLEELDRGEYVEFNDELIEQIKREGRARLEQIKRDRKQSA